MCRLCLLYVGVFSVKKLASAVLLSVMKMGTYLRKQSPRVLALPLSSGTGHRRLRARGWRGRGRGRGGRRRAL